MTRLDAAKDFQKARRYLNKGCKLKLSPMEIMMLRQAEERYERKAAKDRKRVSQ